MTVRNDVPVCRSRRDTRIAIGAMTNEWVGSGALDKTMKARFGVVPVTQAR